MSKTIITVQSTTKQSTNKNCTEAKIWTSGIIWCKMTHVDCMFVQCTEKSNNINVKVVK